MSVTFLPATLTRLLACCVLLFAASAQAQLEVSISGAGENRYPIGIANFANEDKLKTALSPIVRNNLVRSGVFVSVEMGPTAMPAEQNPNLPLMRFREIDALVTGSYKSTASGGTLRFKVYNVATQKILGDSTVQVLPGNERTSAHAVADTIYKMITGSRGVFSTRIAYVVKSGAQYQLQIADADGERSQTALSSREPIISPAWSPDGTRLAYVSFESQKPVVYVHTLTTGQRRAVANFKGSNSAPAWSPDGRQLAIVLSKDGSSQMYIMSSDGQGLRRLASSSSLDTEPSFSPDNKWIYFSSDRGGGAQIYRLPVSGGSAERISINGDYNVSPRLSPDGKTLCFITRENREFHVALMDIATRQVQILSDTTADESPSFAPNGRMILYATKIGGRETLASVSVDGLFKQKLSSRVGDIREPTWGPFIN